MNAVVALLPEQARPYAKALVTLAGLVLTVLVVLLPGAHWLPIAVQVATLLGVYATPNAEPADPTFIPED